MSFKNILFGTLSVGVLFFISAKNNFALDEAIDNQKYNYQKLSVDISNIADERAITHIFTGSTIITRFSPINSRGEKIELHRLASQLGYDHFNWVNYVEKDPYGIADTNGKQLTTPYNDPPKNGYQYDRADGFPFYWDIEQCDRCKQRHHFQNYNNHKQYELIFEDAPADYRLQPGEAVEFITHLVGVKEIDSVHQRAKWDILHTFRWKLTNPRPNYSQVSLVEANVDLDRLSPMLLNTMLLDGATVGK